VLLRPPHLRSVGKGGATGRRLRWYCRRGDDINDIADAFALDDAQLDRSRVYQHRQRGYDLPMRRRADCYERRRESKRTRPCLVCDDPFLSDGNGHRICGVCKGTRFWDAGSSVYDLAEPDVPIIASG